MKSNLISFSYHLYSKPFLKYLKMQFSNYLKMQTESDKFVQRYSNLLYNITLIKLNNNYL